MSEELPVHRPSTGRRRSSLLTALAAAVAVFGMVGLSFAAVPLYRIFCQVTGYGGTTQRAEQGADRILDRVVTVRFDANVAKTLGWDFAPEQREVKVRLGETSQIAYRAHNRNATANTGSAVFNVVPEQAGSYFNKIACFCFTEQTLQPGQTVDMPVTFFVDPAILDDPDLADVHTITLSYTFFESADGNPPPTAEEKPTARLDGAAAGAGQPSVN